MMTWVRSKALKECVDKTLVFLIFQYNYVFCLLKYVQKKENKEVEYVSKMSKLKVW